MAADGAYTRIWNLADLHRSRLAGLLIVLAETLVSKGYSVNDYPYCEAARDAYDQLPERGEYGPFRESRPTTVNDIFAAAVDAGVEETTEVDPEVETSPNSTLA